MTTERTHLLDIPWTERGMATTYGAKWDKSLRAWLYTGELPWQLAPYASRPFSWERWQEDKLNGPDAGAAYLDDNHAPTGVELHPHQQEAADAMVDAYLSDLPGFLLADDVGLGKTYATIAGVMRMKPTNVAVLCPLAVVPHWRKSIAAMGADRDINWLVINYDRTKNLLSVPKEATAAKKTRTKNRKIAALGKPLINWDVIVFDEAHLLRNPQSQRSTACRRLAGEGSDHKAFCLWLSATAGQNPLHLSYLAPILAASTGTTVGDLTDFQYWAESQNMEVRQGAYGAWEWVRNEADLDHMRHILFENTDPLVGIRRRPTDIAGWPEQQRIPYPIDLDPRGWELYDDAWLEFRREVNLAMKGRNPQNLLVEQLRFRQKASYVRVPGTVELVEDLLSNDLQVAVSVQFLESVDALRDILEAKKIKVATIVGDMTADEKEAERIRFQQGDAPVILFTPTEGISLHAGEAAAEATDMPRVTVLHDVRYSALSCAQIEGRCHRDGQNAIAYYVYADRTVEENIIHKTIQRLTDMATMLGDDTEWVEEIYDTIREYKRGK
jgi:hypothetical protein